MQRPRFQIRKQVFQRKKRHYFLTWQSFSQSALSASKFLRLKPLILFRSFTRKSTPHILVQTPESLQQQLQRKSIKTLTSFSLTDLLQSMFMRFLQIENTSALKRPAIQTIARLLITMRLFLPVSAME